MQKIVKTSIAFTVLSLLASAFNMLYYPVVSHLLSLSQFGDVQIGISFIMMSAALFSSLNIVALYSMSRAGSGNTNSLAILERTIISVSIILAILVIVFARPLSQGLNMQDESLLYLLSVIFIMNIPAASWVGALQGNRQFIASGVIGLVSSLLKLLISCLAILLGFGAHGALAGILIGLAAILPLVVLLQNKPVVSFKRTFSVVRATDLRHLINEGSSVIILTSLVFITVLTSLDITVAKFSFDSSVAGEYAQASTAAKITFFSLIPMAIILFEKFIRSPQKILRDLLTYSALAITLSGALYLVRYPLMTEIFNYKGDIGVYEWLLVTYTSITIITLLAYIMIARGLVTRLLKAAAMGLAFTIIMLLTHSSNPMEVASSFAISAMVILMIYIATLSGGQVPQRSSSGIMN